MKVFIVISIICLLGNALALSLEEEFKMAEKACLEEKQLSKEEVFGRQDLSNPTPSLKIFAGCFLEKVGFIKDGILQENVMLEKSKSFEYPKYFKNCVRMCRHIEGIDQNDTAYKLGLCFGKVHRQLFKKEWKVVSNDCKKENQLSEEEYSKLQYQPLDNPTVATKHYAKCVFEKQGFLKDNVLQEDVVLEVSEDYKDAEFLKTFVSKCKQIKDDNEYNTALKLFDCLQTI